jgi:hypothetical protein
MDNQHEFRIGNYVDYFHETVDRWVNWTQIDATKLQAIGLGNQASGIELKYFILEQFGFRKNYGWTGNEFYCLMTPYIEFQFDKDGLGISIENQYLTLSHIKYVHQLQNLYYSLTGTELEPPPRGGRKSLIKI